MTSLCLLSMLDAGSSTPRASSGPRLVLTALSRTAPRNEKCRLGRRFDAFGERSHLDPKNVRLVERIVMLLSVVHRVAIKLALLQNDVACGIAGGGWRYLP